MTGLALDKPGYVDMSPGNRSPALFSLPFSSFSPFSNQKSMGWRHFGREARRFQRSPRHSRPIPSGRKLLVLGRALRVAPLGARKTRIAEPPGMSPLQTRSGFGRGSNFNRLKERICPFRPRVRSRRCR
jgi:hypothetical protein